MNILLPVLETEKDLGVTMSNNLDFTDYINSFIAKANFMIAWVTDLQIHDTTAHGVLDFICYRPCQCPPMVLIQASSIQNQMLKKLGPATLLERRARGDVETFKIINGFSNFGDIFFLGFLVLPATSGDKLVSRPGDEHRQNSFWQYSKYWNKLPFLTITYPN